MTTFQGKPFDTALLASGESRCFANEEFDALHESIIRHSIELIREKIRAIELVPDSGERTLLLDWCELVNNLSINFTRPEELLVLGRSVELILNNEKGLSHIVADEVAKQYGSTNPEGKRLGVFVKLQQ